MDMGDVTDGRLVSPSLASAPLPAAYAGEGKEQEEGEREEESSMPITIKVNKVNGDAAGHAGVEKANGGSGIAGKAQPAAEHTAASAATRPGGAVPVDEAGLDRVSDERAAEGGKGEG